jgi:hypothetical protein
VGCATTANGSAGSVGSRSNSRSSSSNAASESGNPAAKKSAIPAGLLDADAATQHADEINQLLSDKAYASELLQQLPGVDPDDASVQAAMRILRDTSFFPFNSAITTRKGTGIAFVPHHEALFAANRERAMHLLRRWAH